MANDAFGHAYTSFFSLLFFSKSNKREGERGEIKERRH